MKQDPLADRVRLTAVLRGLTRTLPNTPRNLGAIGHMLRVRLGRPHSIGRVLEAQARKRPGADAVRGDGRTWSYGEFNRWANRLADALAESGVRPGDVVALLAETHPAGLAAVAAIVKMGAVAGLLNPKLRDEGLRHSLRTMDAKRLIVSADCLDAWADLEPDWNGPSPDFIGGYAEAACPTGWRNLARDLGQYSADNPASTEQVQASQPAFYILTSGTTGLPKASVMSHRRWLRSMAGLGTLALRLTPKDTLYCALPLHHNNALTVSWGAVLGTGAAIALDRKFSASRFWERIRHYDATGFTYIGELCRWLLQQPPAQGDRDHRVRVCVGNGLRPEIWDDFKQRFGIEHICEFYGASEANLAFANAFNVERTAGFCPYPYEVVECDEATAQPRRDAKGRFVAVRPGGVGLLITEVTDDAPFEGYTDASAGRDKLLHDGLKKGDCWFNTGDLVRNQGWKHIQFVDRLGDTYRWKGENVATTEVEAVLMRQPGVARCAVYGVAVPGVDGRAGMAAVQFDDGASLDTTGLASALRAALPAYAVPVFLRLVDTLAETSTFKTQKHALREQGADPAQVRAPLYLLVPGAAQWCPLDTQTWKEVGTGNIRL